MTKTIASAFAGLVLGAGLTTTSAASVIDVSTECLTRHPSKTEFPQSSIDTYTLSFATDAVPNVEVIGPQTLPDGAAWQILFLVPNPKYYCVTRFVVSSVPMASPRRLSSWWPSVPAPVRRYMRKKKAWCDREYRKTPHLFTDTEHVATNLETGERIVIGTNGHLFMGCEQYVLNRMIGFRVPGIRGGFLLVVDRIFYDKDLD